MSSHSQFKRLNILQQLEQAIKKKTHEKYKSKSKSKHPTLESRPIELKPSKTPILEKQSVGVPLTRKSNQAPIQPPPPTVKSKQIDFKVKKYQNKKFDKIVSLINYTITSADKALKYVTLSSNFEAEFAYKLYLSDRQNLMNELNNLNLTQIITSINPMSNMSNMIQQGELKALQSNQHSNIEIHSLKNENDKLKKEIMIMEGEIKKYKHREHEQKSNTSSPLMGKVELQKEDLLKRQIDVKQIQVNKLSDLLKRLCNFNEVYDYLDLVDKEMKYRSALASAGLSGFQLNKIQREDFERNLVSLDGRIGELQGMMIAKMEKMAQGEDEEVLQELQAINKLLHRKIAPILKENQQQSLQNKKISDIIGMYVNYAIKKQRDLSGSLQKMQGKLIDYIQMAKDSEKKDHSTEHKFEQLYKENELVKTNLKDIYEELKALLRESLRKSGISDQADITFETLLKQIEFTLIKNAEVKGMEKKLKQVSEEEGRKNALIMKQNSIIESMEHELNEMQGHLKDSEERKKEVEEYVLLLQKKKKEESREYEEMRGKFENYAKQVQESETLLYQKETMIKKLQEEMEQTKVDIHKLSSLVRSKEQQIQERQEFINQRETKIQKLVAENNIQREEGVEIKGRLEQEMHEKNKILEHMRFLEDRLKQAENHIEAIGEESNQKVKELNLQLRTLTNSVKEAHQQREHFQVMYQNLLQTRDSEDQRRMGTFKQVQLQLEQLQLQNHSYLQENTNLTHQFSAFSAKAQAQQQALIAAHEDEREQLMSELIQLKVQIQELRADRQLAHESSQMHLMQQNVSSQQDIIEEINHKEEHIIELKRTVQELQAQVEDKQAELLDKQNGIEQLEADSSFKQNTIKQLELRVQAYVAQIQQAQASLESVMRQSQEVRSKNTVLEQKLLEVEGQLINKSPAKSHNDSLAYEQQLRIEQMEETLTQTYAQINSKQHEIETLKNQLSSKDSHFIQLQHQMTQLETLLEQKETDLDNRDAQLQAKQTLLQQKYNELQERFNHLQERQTHLKAKDQQLQTSHQQLNAKLTHQQQQQSLFQSITTQTQLSQQHHDLQQRHHELQLRHHELQLRQQTLELKQKQLEEKEEEINSRLSELQERHSALEERQLNLDQRESQLQERKSQIIPQNQFKSDNSQEHYQQQEQQQQEQQQQDSQQDQQQQDQQQQDSRQQDFASRCAELQALVQRYNQELQQRDQFIQQNHIQLQSNQSQIASLTLQLQQLTDTLTTERTVAQSLSFHISNDQQTIQLLQQKVQKLQVIHEEKNAEIQSLNQKVQELYVEIVELKRKSAHKNQLKEQRSDDLIMSIESSIKAGKLHDSPIGNLDDETSPQKNRRNISRNENANNEQDQDEPRFSDEESPIENLQGQNEPQAEKQQEEVGQGEQSDLLKEGSNSKSAKNSDNWLLGDEIEKQLACESQVRQVAKRQSQQIEQYQGSTIEIIETKYKRLITELKSQVEDKEEGISQVRKSHELLQNQNNELIVHIQLIERAKLQLENQLVGLREIARQRMEENDRLNDELVAVKQQGEENTKRVVKEIQEYEELYLAPLRLRVQEKDQQIEEANERYRELQMTLNQTKRTKQQYIEALQNQSSLKEEEFQARLQDLRTQVDQQRLQMMKLQQEHRSLEVQHQHTKASLQLLQQQSLKSNSKAIHSLQTEISILRDENQLIQTKQNSTQLRTDIKIRQLRGEMMRLTAEIRMKSDEIASLKEELQEEQSNRDNFGSLSSSILVKNCKQIDYLKRQVEEAKDKVLRNSILLEQAERKITLLQEQLSAASHLAVQKNAQANELQSVIEELKYMNHSLSQSVTGLNGQLEQKQMQIEHLKISSQIQVYQNYQSPQRSYHEVGNQHQSTEGKNAQVPVQGNNLEEFDYMRSEKMNESMMSNEPEAETLPRRVNEQNEVHEARLENFLSQNLPVPSQQYEESKIYHSSSPHTYQYHTSTHYTEVQQTRTYRQFTHQQHQEATEQQAYEHLHQEQSKSRTDEFFDQFNDMKSQKMNQSMVSNDATEERGQYYQRQVNIVQDQYFTQNIQETPNSEPGQYHPHQFDEQAHRKLPATEIYQSEQNAQGQDFDEFNDMKSQQMNASMISNEPEPNHTRQEYQEQGQEVAPKSDENSKVDQKLQSGKNIVDAHEDREHSEGSYEDQVAVQKEVTQYLTHQYDLASPQKHQQLVEIQHHEHLSEQAAEQVESPHKQQEEGHHESGDEDQQQGNEQQDLDQFNDMQSEKMNDSMMSNEPQPTEHQQIFRGHSQVPHHQNLVSLHEDKQRSQGQIGHQEEPNQKQEQTELHQHFKSQEEIPVQLKDEKEEDEEHGQDFDEFNDMKSQQMNASMMSNELESAQQENQAQAQAQQQTHKVPQKQIEREGQEHEADLEEFNDMGSEKMNESMMSNQPEPTQTDPIRSPVHMNPDENIVDANEDREHSEGSQVHQYEFKIHDVEFDIEPSQPETHSQKIIGQKQVQEKGQEFEPGQYFDQFNDMRSEKMNESMMSNDPEPSQHPDYAYRQIQEQHKNIVKANEEVEHSEGQHIDVEDLGDEDQVHPKSVQQFVLTHDETEAPLNQAETQIEQPEQQYEQPEQQFDEPKEQQPDFDEFNDMKSQQMNASMVSNDPEPTQNLQHQQQYQIHNQQHINLVSTQINRTPRSQCNYHQSEVSQVVIHRTLAVAQIPEDSDINNFNQIAKDRMNESMMSNEPQVSDKLHLDQPSDNDEDYEPNVQKNQIFQHNLVTISRASEINKNQEGETYFHDGMSEGGNVQMNKEEFEEEEQDIVEIENKKKSIIETHHNQYRSEYEFGNSPFGQSRDEEGLEMLRTAGKTKEFNGSIASNEVEINDIGGHFINEYALNAGRNNKVERNIIKSHNHLEERSQRNLQHGDKDVEVQSIDRQEQGKVYHSSSRSEYAYNHFAPETVGKATSEQRQQSDSMVEDRNQEDQEKDDEVMEEPLKVEIQDEEQDMKNGKQLKGENFEEAQVESEKEQEQKIEKKQEHRQIKQGESEESEADQQEYEQSYQEEYEQSYQEEYEQSYQEEYERSHGADHNHLSQQLQQPEPKVEQPQQPAVDEKQCQYKVAEQNRPPVQHSLQLQVDTIPNQDDGQQCEQDREEYNHQQMEDYEEEALGSSRLLKQANELDAEPSLNRSAENQSDQEGDASGQENYRGRNSLPLYTQENFGLAETQHIHSEKPQVQMDSGLSQQQGQPQQEYEDQQQYRNGDNENQIAHQQDSQDHLGQKKAQVLQDSSSEQIEQPTTHEYYSTTLHTKHVVKAAEQRQGEQQQQEQGEISHTAVHKNCQEVTTRVETSVAEFYEKHLESSQNTLLSNQNQSLSINQFASTTSNLRSIEESHSHHRQLSTEIELQAAAEDKETPLDQKSGEIIQQEQDNQDQQEQVQEDHQEQEEGSERDQEQNQKKQEPGQHEQQDLEEYLRYQNQEQNLTESLPKAEQQVVSYYLDEITHNFTAKNYEQKAIFAELQTDQNEVQHQEKSPQLQQQEQDQEKQYEQLPEQQQQPIEAAYIVAQQNHQDEYEVSGQGQKEPQNQAEEIEKYREHQQSNDFNAFNDMASQKMNASMMSNNEDPTPLPHFDQTAHQQEETEMQLIHQNDPNQIQVITPHQEELPQETEAQQQGNDFDVFNQMASEKMNASMMSNNEEPNPTEQPQQQREINPHQEQSKDERDSEEQKEEVQEEMKQAQEHGEQTNRQQVRQEQDGNDFDAFNDMASDKMNASMMSNNDQPNSAQPLQSEENHESASTEEQPKIQGQNEPSKEEHPEENLQHQQQGYNDFDAFNEMASEKMDASMMSNYENQIQAANQVEEKPEEPLQEQQAPVQTDQNNFSNFNDMPSENMGNSMISNQDPSSEPIAHNQPLTQILEDSPQKLTASPEVLHTPQQTVQSAEKGLNLDELEEDKSENEDDQGNFSNFMEMPNQQMGASIISNHEDQPQAHPVQTQQIAAGQEVSLPKNQPEATQDHLGQNNFSDFNDMASQKMGQSMMSDQQEDQNNFSDFNDMASEKMGSSMISNNENFGPQYPETNEDKQLSPVKDKSPEKHQVDEGNDFDAFNSMVEEKMDGSMVSNNEEKKVDWFGENIQNPAQNQPAQEQGFSDFKEYNSEHMSQSQLSAQGEQMQQASFQPDKNPLKLQNLGANTQNLEDLLGMEKVLPSDIFLTSERKYEVRHETSHDDEEEDFNALINFLPQSTQKPKTEQEGAEQEGMETNRSNSFNEDGFDFQVRKSVESIGSRADIFENFQNPIGSKISSDGDFKSNEMIKSAKRIQTIKGKGADLFGFDDIMEQEHESSQHSSTYQKQNDNDFGDYLSKGHEPAPSPVNKRSEENDFFDFDKVAQESEKKESPNKFNPFEDFE